MGRPPLWMPGVRYHVGDRRLFRSIRMVCCCEHGADRSAEHPWHAVLPPERLEGLWAPDGEVEAAKLRAAAETWGGKLGQLGLLAAGPRHTLHPDDRAP